ncbi:odorant receptor 4-like isoform X2 [Harpegnathos saltator]|uniref:odorant receptor 4-like isoform X2 n=1 Tax=Harpegnathos saltator TaxID=610380 RepID=UPI000DBEDF34|nr:odorant receptor 4-like isoform X2 [Harpegnathos saltator]
MKSVESGCTKTKTTDILSRFPPSPINMKMSTLSRVMEIGLQACGVWPYLPSTVLYRLLWVVTLGIVQVLQYQYLLIHYHSDNFADFMDGVSSTMAYTLLFIKLIILWANQRTFDKILTMMAVDWEKCANTEFSMFAMTSKAKVSHWLANWTITLYSIAVVLYSSDVLLYRLNISRISNSSARPFILKMEIPFDSDKRFVYESIIITQFFHLVSCSCTFAAINVLLIILILHVAGQIDILCEWLVEIFPLARKCDLNLIMIRKVIKTHQKIITFSEHIEDLYSGIAMVIFISDTLIICCLGFVIVASVGTPGASKIIIKTFLFYIVMNLEAFIFCFAGEYLSAKSQTVGDAAYDSLWYESNPKNSRLMLLLIMRSQNQLTITIGKVMDLSLERFSGIVKASASYISVLLAMY